MALDVLTSGKMGLRDPLSLHKCRGHNGCWDMMRKGEVLGGRAQGVP